MQSLLFISLLPLLVVGLSSHHTKIATSLFYLFFSALFNLIFGDG